jgi:hypothetical protein
MSLSKLGSVVPKLGQQLLLTSVSVRHATYKGIYLGPGPYDIDLDDGGTKPDGVPESWTACDIQTDYGHFDEDTFPPCLEGETLEQYCRRVPNVWSPCSSASDVVETAVFMGLEWAQDWGPTKMGMLEEALLKIPPESADWHVTYQIDCEHMLRDMMLRTRPFPIRVSETEFDTMVEKFAAGIKTRGIDHHFRARSFHEFWTELTGEDLKQTANVPTWEEEIENRIAAAKIRNATRKSNIPQSEEAESITAH